jgi:hypothetical protein
MRASVGLTTEYCSPHCASHDLMRASLQYSLEPPVLTTLVGLLGHSCTVYVPHHVHPACVASIRIDAREQSAQMPPHIVVCSPASILRYQSQMPTQCIDGKGSIINAFGAGRE